MRTAVSRKVSTNVDLPARTGDDEEMPLLGADAPGATIAESRWYGG